MIHQEMTEAEKHQFLDEKIRQGGGVFCPWCKSINQPGNEDSPCCTPFRLAIKDRADGLVRNFASQYTAVEIGLSSSITCPWCRLVNRAPGPEHPADWKRPGVSPFCCSMFEYALAAHLEVKRVQGLVRQADQIAEGLHKAAVN